MIILKPAIFELMAIVRYDHIPIYNVVMSESNLDELTRN